MASRPIQATAGPLLLLLVALACGRADELPSAGDVAGTYEHSHQVWVFHGSEPVEVEVADRLLLTADDATTLHFRLEYFAVNSQECRLEGLAHRRRDHFVHAAPGASDPCELRFRPLDASLVVTDVESRCSRIQCGEAGALGEVSFKRLAGED